MAPATCERDVDSLPEHSGQDELVLSGRSAAINVCAWGGSARLFGSLFGKSDRGTARGL